MLNQNLDVLNNKNKIIEEQIAFKEQILANVNHELRTPLNAIIGMCSLMEETSLSKVQKEYTDILRRSGENLMIIINDFLTISSMKAGKFEFKLRSFTFKELFHDLDNIFSIVTTSKGIQLSFEESSFIETAFLGDPTRIFQIFQNLLNNAIKFTTEGSVNVSSRVIDKEENFKVIEFTIRDTGIGIPLANQESIFESFTQAHKAEEHGYNGTGLGLNIVKNLVQLMDGSISFTSEENVGTSFVIKLPFELAPEGEQVGASHVKRMTVPEDWKGLKFLMIEDNLANIVYARELFKRWKLDIKFCKNYKSGLKEATHNFYDLILCDLNMPDGYGIDLLQDIRSNENAKCQKSKMAIITASILQVDKDNAENFDIDGYVEKPFTPQSLLSELHLILKSNFTLEPEPDQVSEELDNGDVQGKLDNISKNPNVQLEFLNVFLSQFKLDVVHLGRSVNDKDHESIYQTAHKMRSSLKIFDLEMYEQVTLLEKYGSDKEDFCLIQDEFLSFNKTYITRVAGFESTMDSIKHKLASMT